MSFPAGNSAPPSRGRQKPEQQPEPEPERSAMRHQLKPSTPSAAARLRYITREGRYAVGLDGPRDDLRATGSANLPSWARGDAAVFWSAVDGYERANARRCLELELNLPRELGRAQQVAAVRDYLARLTAEAGPMPCTWAIHNAGDGNPHVHLMIQERPLDGHERTAETWFKRANRQQPEKGGAIKSQWWHDRENVFWSRALWADACNQALTQAGHEARFDARSKVVRLDDALRAGDLRAAALLTTVTERHEGVAVAGMRRRVDRGEIELDELPDYAQQLIRHNDRARDYNNQLRDWARSASDAELRGYLAPQLTELTERLEVENPGAHVAAWIASAHEQDRQRAVASALAAGELELLAAQQIEIEQAHAEALAEAAQREQMAIAAELADLMTGEALDIVQQRLALEREQAHGAALIEHALRAEARRRAEARQQAEQIAQQQRGQAEAQRQQVIEHARSEYRAADRRVLEALAALQRAQGTLEYQQRRLAEVPALQKQRGALVGQANEHAAAVKRLRAERAAWLADHPILRRAGLTGPADALLEQETKHFEVYERLAAEVEQIDSRVRSAQPAVEQAQRAVDAAEAALREAEARANQRFDDAGGPDAALRRAGLAQPAPLRERFVQGLQQMEQRLDELDDDGPTITPPGGPRFRY